MGEAIGIFMLHPDTFAAGMAVGLPTRWPPTSPAVAVFWVRPPESRWRPSSPSSARFRNGLWAEGIAVRGAVGAADLYRSQTADFGRKYLAPRSRGLDRLAELAEGHRGHPGPDCPCTRAGEPCLLSTTPGAGDAGDVRSSRTAGRSAFQCIDEFRHHPGLKRTCSNKGAQCRTAHARMFGWPEPFADGADKKKIYDLVEDSTNQRMSEILGAALDSSETAELARLSVGALEALKAAVTR